MVGVALAAACAAVLLLMRPEDYNPSDGIVRATLPAAFVLVSCFSLLTALAGPGRKRYKYRLTKNQQRRPTQTADT